MSSYRNILVINLMHLGDLMLVTPVLRTLRHNYPAARITLLADEKLADIVQENRHIDECLLIDKKGRDNSLLGILRFARRLRRLRLEHALALIESGSTVQAAMNFCGYRHAGRFNEAFRRHYGFLPSDVKKC